MINGNADRKGRPALGELELLFVGGGKRSAPDQKAADGHRNLGPFQGPGKAASGPPSPEEPLVGREPVGAGHRDPREIVKGLGQIAVDATIPIQTKLPGELLGLRVAEVANQGSLALQLLEHSTQRLLDVVLVRGVDDQDEPRGGEPGRVCAVTVPR